MSIYTIVQNGISVNTINADDTYIEVNHDDDIVIRGEYPLGYELKDGNLVNPIKIAVNTADIMNTSGYTNQAITVITKRSFMQRFTQAERTAIRNSTDDIVIDIYEDLQSASSVDLALPELTQGLAYLVGVNLLTSNRPAELLVDGSVNEAF